MLPVYQKARRHLARRDAVLKQIIRAIGPCTLQQKPDRFWALVRSIISQQISTKAAAAIAGRLEARLTKPGVTPRSIMRLSSEGLRQVGLSASKSRALLDLALKVKDAIVPLEDMHELPDEEVIDRLIVVRGIGRWTAEMFLIFALGRLDVLPVDDWGFRVAVQRQYGLGEAPKKAALIELAEPWRPYRSIATWYFWRSLGFVPQSNL